MALAATVLLPLLIFCSAMVFLFDRQQQEQVERMLSQTARNLSDAVDRQLINHVSGLEALATSIHLDNDNIADFSIEAERLLNSRPEWMSLRLRRAADAAMLVALFPERMRDSVPSDQLPPPAAQEQIRKVVVSGRTEVSDLREIAGAEPFISLVVPGDTRWRGPFRPVRQPAKPQLQQCPGRPALPENWVGSVLDRETDHSGPVPAP